MYERFKGVVFVNELIPRHIERHLLSAFTNIQNATLVCCAHITVRIEAFESEIGNDSPLCINCAVECFICPVFETLLNYIVY